MEYIDGIEVIKAFGKTESSYAKFTKAAFEYADSFYFLDETVLDLSWTDDGGHTLYASYGIAVWGTLW